VTIFEYNPQIIVFEVAAVIFYDMFVIAEF